MLQLCRVPAEGRHTHQNPSHHQSLLNRLEYCGSWPMMQMRINLTLSKSHWRTFLKSGFLNIEINFLNYSYSNTYFLIPNSLCVILIVYPRVSEMLIRNPWLHGWRPDGLCVHVCLVCILANAKYWGLESAFHYQSEDIWAGPADIPKRSDYLSDVFTPTEI